MNLKYRRNLFNNLKQRRRDLYFLFVHINFNRVRAYVRGCGHRDGHVLTFCVHTYRKKFTRVSVCMHRSTSESLMNRLFVVFLYAGFCFVRTINAL